MADETDAWPAEATDILLADIAAGRSVSQIASKLTEKGYPRSRNAVLGKIHRLRKTGRLPFPPPRLPYEAEPQRVSDPVPRSRKASRPRALPVEPGQPFIGVAGPVFPDAPPRGSAGGPIGFYDQWPRAACRYPLYGDVFDPSAPLFCGAPAREGSSYCAEHHALTHEPRKAGRDAA